MFRSLTWLKAPASREVIRRWTRRDDLHRLQFPPDWEAACGTEWSFLALGDSGDSDPRRFAVSPQEAVAQHMAADAALPETGGTARLVLHTGDVVYMAGEKRLYDRYFRRPYAPFLTRESTVERLVFRLPFLPVPGNHDYYDLSTVARAITRAPLLGPGVRAIARELFAYNMSRGGSEMGRAFMDAFIERAEGSPQPYVPGEQTRLPNRYYTFSLGGVDFFALDSNTLEAPSPAVDSARVRAVGAQRVVELEARARALQRELKRDEEALDEWERLRRTALAQDPARFALLGPAREHLVTALVELWAVVKEVDAGAAAVVKEVDAGAAAAVEDAERAWRVAEMPPLQSRPTVLESRLSTWDTACSRTNGALSRLEPLLSRLTDSPHRTRLLAAREAVESALVAWRRASQDAPPVELSSRLRTLTDQALDLQRELALAQRRAHHRPEDFDLAQLQWLDAALRESELQRPGAWRVLYLHHPLFTTLTNHCEHGDVQAVRANLLELLRGRVHLILAGHSHAFEWVRSSELPTTGLFVTGAGGQISLRRSVMDPRAFPRYRGAYQRLRLAGAAECAVGGRGPTAADGENGPLYHYVRVEVTPDCLRVRPVGVRRLRDGYRREEPMPVGYVESLPEDGAPPWEVRRMTGVEIRRDRLPVPLWSE